ncbi:hypothetical protein F4861DRAFT_527249 [Xylaria intraflava]|nr:hypothetical protein F4861DRAFT_527249 [Xylaria intraflava]
MSRCTMQCLLSSPPLLLSSPYEPYQPCPILTSFNPCNRILNHDCLGYLHNFRLSVSTQRQGKSSRQGYNVIGWYV